MTLVSTGGIYFYGEFSDMSRRIWIFAIAVILLVGGFIIFASISERSAESKARSFCSKFRTGDDFNAAIDLMNSTEASDKWISKENRLSIMFSSYDPQSVYACEIDGKDGKIVNVRYRHLDQD